MAIRPVGNRYSAVGRHGFYYEEISGELTFCLAVDMNRNLLSLKEA
jgi:hypothetical protein